MRADGQSYDEANSRFSNFCERANNGLHWQKPGLPVTSKDVNETQLNIQHQGGPGFKCRLA